MRYALYLLLFLVLAVEILTRIFMPEAVSVLIHDERSLTYDYDPVLGWFPKRGDQREFTGSRKILVSHNSRGFRDREPGLKTKPRIVFLGDSFVWGYDVEQEERFTEKLQEKLPEFEILNLGVSGYGTDQALLLLEREFSFYQPDFVLLIFSPNDRRDNSSSMAYGYGKPYFVRNHNGVLLPQGIPARRSSVYLLKKKAGFFKESVFLNMTFLIFEKLRDHEVPDPTEVLVGTMASFTKERGSHFAIGMVDSDLRLQQFCVEKRIPVVDLSQVDSRYRFPSHGQHWTPEGHVRVSQQIYDFLSQDDFLAAKHQKVEITR